MGKGRDEQYIIHWVNNLNSNFKEWIPHSGFITAEFDIQKRYRQGDPLIPYQFSISADIHSIHAKIYPIHIKPSQDITSILINNK